MQNMERKKYLGDITPKQFLKKYWQKSPYLIRDAIAPEAWSINLDELIKISQHPMCTTRLILKEGGEYDVHHGPVSKKIISSLPKRDWTFLVQGANHANVHIDSLLNRFSFLPFARLDDVMVSYAAPGGGVGPHFDSYDVFLLQGAGKRRWHVSTSDNRELLPEQDLKLLKNFQADGTCDVSLGDMLYIPPDCGHHGIAIDPCLTYSIGFRSPNYELLKTEFLHFLDESITLSGLYSDKARSETNSPGQIPRDMLTNVCKTLSKIRWSQSDIDRFLGEFLSRNDVLDELHRPPPLTEKLFIKHLKQKKYQFHPAVRCLYSNNRGYIAGEMVCPTINEYPIFRKIADSRTIIGAMIPPYGELSRFIYHWYTEGFLIDD